MGWWLPLPLGGPGCCPPPHQPLAPSPALTALGPSLLTHRAEEALGVRHHSQEVLEVHMTISCEGQKSDRVGGAQSVAGQRNPGMVTSKHSVEVLGGM